MEVHVAVHSGSRTARLAGSVAGSTRTALVDMTSSMFLRDSRSVSVYGESVNGKQKESRQEAMMNGIKE